MGRMKCFLEDFSVALGYDGEITPEIQEVASKILELTNKKNRDVFIRDNGMMFPKRRKNGNI